MILTTKDIDKIVELLLADKVGVLPTDTIYGLHCLANSSEAIRKISQLKQRAENMHYITLVGSIEDLGFVPSEFELTQIEKYWPGPNTLILRGHSYRLSAYDFLQVVLEETGPLISTSANIHGQPSALSIADAQNYFGGSVAFYVKAGLLNNPPSNIYKVLEDRVEVIR